MPKDEDPKKVDAKPDVVKKPRVKKPAAAAAPAKPKAAAPAKPKAAAAAPAKPTAIKSTAFKPAADKPTPAAIDDKPIATLKAPEPAKPAQKKRNIPKRVKDLTWEKWVGKDVATHACLCCQKAEIRMNSFHCGHVLAEADGGLTEPDNLRPICADCNLSMGRENFNDFKARCGFNKKPRKPAAKKKKSSAKDDIENKKIINLLINYMEKKL